MNTMICEGMIHFGWQDIYFVLSILATIAGGLRLGSSDPKKWRQGGLILLAIPLLFCLLLFLSSLGFPRSGLELIPLTAPLFVWSIYKLWKGSNRERLYVAILLLTVAAICLWFIWMFESDRRKYGLPP